jgi:hypothetical protein
MSIGNQIMLYASLWAFFSWIIYWILYALDDEDDL